MKIWQSYGSEHSANLIMIGYFKKAGDAKLVNDLIEELGKQVEADGGVSGGEPAPEGRRFSKSMSALLEAHNLYVFGPADLEQFAYDASVEQLDERIIVKTDEYDISAYLKLFVERGARVEIYSGHDYPDKDSHEAR